jgi:hypothetical protein
MIGGTGSGGIGDESEFVPLGNREGGAGGIGSVDEGRFAGTLSVGRVGVEAVPAARK